MKEALRLFISHSWAEKELVRKIEAELTSSNIEFWVDHSAIRVGDNLPERISTALEWSNTLLLIWSK
ncbi:MAG: toll/interleukin-1 receptor domain-containing protein, partial [Calditrichaeota bacterium]|nr:toll/interleukin-1 receptor domain-containing protein [Calditrichota bacterium]